MKTRISNLFRASGPVVPIVDQGIVSIGNFLAIVIPSKILDGREFGVYVVCIISIFMLTGITKGLITNPLRVLGVDIEDSERDAYVSDQIFYMTLFSIPLAVGMYLAIPMMIDASWNEAMVAGVAFFCFQIHDLSRAVRSVEFKWRMLLFSDMIFHVIRLTGLGFLWLYGAMDVIYALLLYAVSAIASVSFTGFLLNIKKFHLDRFKRSVKHTWGYGRWLLGDAIVTVLSTQGYVLFVGIFLSTALAGIYGALQQLVNVINVIHIATVSYVAPNVRRKLNNKDYSGWKNWLCFSALVLFVLTVLIVTTLGIFGAHIIEFLYNAEWSAYTPVLYLLGIAVTFSSINIMLDVAFRTSNLPQVGLLAKAIAAIVTLIVASPLIREWGIYGAATGVIITQLCWFSVYLYETYGRSRLTEANVYSLMKLYKIDK